MRKIIKVLIAAFAATMISALPAMAGTWQGSPEGWWWQRGDGSYPAGQWEWCDGDLDGTAQCYYFDESGYCLYDTITPDGFYVNEDGAWTENGVIQSKYVGVQDEFQQKYGSDTYSPAGIYSLLGVENVITGETSSQYGYLTLDGAGSGIMNMGGDSPHYNITWYSDGDKIYMNDGFGTTVGEYYDALRQINIPVEDYIFYFQDVLF